MKQTTKTLIKDVIFMSIPWTIGIIWAVSMTGGFDFAFLIAGAVFAGIPFGWRWLSNIITAIGLWGILIKGFGAMVLGWIALPVVMTKDIVAFVRARKEDKTEYVLADPCPFE